MKKALALALLLSTAAVTFAIAQGGPGGGPGPQPQPSPWLVNGSTISYNGCITVPAGVTGGCKGAGTINATGIYVNGSNAISVTSVFGRSGAVVSAVGDYGFGQISGTAAATQGGTGLTGGTSGGVLYFSATNAISSSAMLSANQLVVGGGTAAAPKTVPALPFTLDVNLNASSLQAAQAGTIFQAANADGTQTRSEMDAYAAAGYFSSVRADGTSASPTTLVNADEIGGFNGWGYDGAAYVGPRGAFRIFAGGTWTGSSQPTYADVATTPSAGTAQVSRQYWGPDGGSYIGSPTGGDEGIGTINAQGLYINGVSVATTGDSVASFSGGATGLTPNTATTGPITLAGILSTTNGGLGANNSASSGVPLFASGAITFTGTSGTGNFALVTSPSIASPTITGAFTATGLVTNADLANSSTSVNGNACALGGTCTIPVGISAASSTIASAATTNLSVSSNTLQIISGNTTITSFGTGANLYRIVQFTGTPILTNSSTLITTTGSNIQAAPGDQAVLTSDNSGTPIWRVASYTRGVGPVIQPFGPIITGTTATLLKSFSLTPGRWRLSAFSTDAGSVGATYGTLCFTTTSGSTTGCTFGVNYIFYAYNATAGYGSGAITSYDVTVAATTTYYLNGAVSVTGSLNGEYGVVRADPIY